MSTRIARHYSRPTSRLTVLVVAVLIGCSQEEEPFKPEPPRPAAVTVSPSFATLSSLGDTVSFTARITDQHQSYLSGVVTWSTSDSEVVTVSSAGVVTAIANGSGTVVASYREIRGTASVTVQQAPHDVVTVLGGDQSSLAGHTLPDSVVVRATDAGGSPVEDILVNFTTAEGHGAANPTEAVTDSLGLAATSWTLGPQVGIQILTASVTDDVFAEVRATAEEIEPPPDTAIYRIVFEATWSSTTHPADFPPGAHFSPLIGAIHADTVSFWTLGEIASAGIEQMAETGGTSLLRGEVHAKMPDDALSVVSGSGIGSPGITTIPEVIFTLDYPRVTLVTMIAPSPDWFVGVDGLSLLDESGQWLEERQVVLYPIDAGTDDGTNYRSPNADSSPKQPISSLKGVLPFSNAPIGTYTLKKVHVNVSR